jgi:hypothetical protein
VDVKEQRSEIKGQRSKNVSEILYVQILEAKPNKMFTEEQRAAVRFLRFNRAVPCTECGKRRKVMWTMLCEFRAYDFNAPGLVLPKPKKVHKPMDEVCGDHPLAPAWPEEEKEMNDE